MWRAGSTTSAATAACLQAASVAVQQGGKGAACRRAVWPAETLGGCGFVRGTADDTATSASSSAVAAALSRISRRTTSAELDAWAKGTGMQGHAHSRPTCEPYGLSEMREFGQGTRAAQGWAARLLSSAGVKNGASLNQDSYSYTVLDDGWIVCVTCDGHGDRGEVISERVARMLPLYLSHLLKAISIQEALPRAFREAQSDLERCFASAQTYSGSTAAVCCLKMDTQEVWFAHAGDSRVLLGDLANGTVVFQTEEHKAHDPEEFRRLEEAGAQVIQKRYDDGALVSRIFMPKTGMPGLAMSRSLGDGCLKKYGVIADPEVQEVTGLWQGCEAPVVVLASDGLWDTITVEETITTLAARYSSGLDVQLGAEALLRRSQRLWIEAEADYCDDVTVLLVAPRASLRMRTV